MGTTVFLAVLVAAGLHAGWNALVKRGGDKRVTMGAVALGHVPPALIALLFVPLPARESLPYLVAGTFLHLLYQLFLMRSYETGDLTQVYPIARGSAPLMVALFSVVVLGVDLGPAGIVGILAIGLGIISLALVRRADGLRNAHAARLALTTGLFIACYSVVDGLGARLAGTSLGFFAWLAVANGALMAMYLAATTPSVLADIARHGRGVLAVGGSASFIAYAIVTWAFTQAPIALVTALRETSIVFALLIGVFFLKERLDLAKLASTAAMLAGAVILRFARQS